MAEIIVTSLLSHRTKAGLVQVDINGTRVQLEIAKAREVTAMLHEAIEAAISDQLMFQFLTQKVGLSEDKAAAALIDVREMRQGSRDTVFHQ
jgi:hypothetical protein